jgi:hypothetical protein
MAVQTSSVQTRAPSLTCEVEGVRGLEQIVLGELRQKLGPEMTLNQRVDQPGGSGAIRFGYRGRLARLLKLSTVLSVYLVCPFDVPRPRALMGHAHFSRLLAAAQSVCQVYPPQTFATLGISAAGADTPVMQRLQTMLAAHLGIPAAPGECDLLFRIRPAAQGGWEVLIRLSPKPLSVRPWRVCDVRGALNAAVAHCLVLLTQPAAGDYFLNLGCGSGTLLVERMSFAAQRVSGCDSDPAMRCCAEANLRASGHVDAVELVDWDMGALPLPDGSVDALCADLPFGLAVGSHAENVRLYPQMLAEAARVARPGARCVLLTQETRLLSACIDQERRWKLCELYKIELRGLYPRIFVLERNR